MVAVARAERFSPNLLKKIFYRDIFAPTLINNDTKDIDTVTNEDSIKQALLNMLLTNRGERLFNFNYGSNINYLLFENITPQTTSTLIDYIRTSIKNFEPRVDLLDVIASPSEDQNAYSVTIVFKVINRTEPIRVDFILNRVR